MSTDILYPILIGVGCLAIIVIVHLLTRPKPSKADIRLPESASPADEATIDQLGEWHRNHEATVLGFLDVCDRPDGFDPDNQADQEALAQLDQAIDDHPAPDMRGELATLRASAHAMAAARQRGDTAAIEENQDLYRRYRDAWLDRLWQFPVDAERIQEVRTRGVA
ncbi:MAG: hypothetical protein ACR2PK_04095 [Acidimicrobiales bacterium]